MTGTFNFLDILFLALVILSTLFGIIKGFIRELFSMAFFIVALILSFLYYSDVGTIYSKYLSENIANFAGFVTIFVVVLVAVAVACRRLDFLVIHQQAGDLDAAFLKT